MRTKAFLILDQFGHVRATKRTPILGRGEIAVRLAVSIPDQCFQAPVVDVVLDVPPDRLLTPSASVTVELPEG
jgi:hypothetical protein